MNEENKLKLNPDGVIAENFVLEKKETELLLEKIQKIKEELNISDIETADYTNPLVSKKILDVRKETSKHNKKVDEKRKAISIQFFNLSKEIKKAVDKNVIEGTLAFEILGKEFEEKRNNFLVLESRKNLLPTRWAELVEIGYDKLDELGVSDESILGQDNNQWTAYLNHIIGLKQREEMQKIEIEKEVARAKEKEKIRARMERMRLEEEKQKLEKEKRELADKKREAEKRLKEEDKQREEREKKEREQLANKKRIACLLEGYGYNESTKDDFHLEVVGSVIKIYKKIGEIKK